MLPVPLASGDKKLTKKEILLQVLRYIEHLQASISTAKALLELRRADKEGSGPTEPGAHKRGHCDGTPHRQRAHGLASCTKPRKRKRAHPPERRVPSTAARQLLVQAPHPDAGEADEQLPPWFDNTLVEIAEDGVPFCAAGWHVSRDPQGSRDADLCATCEAQMAGSEQLRDQDRPQLSTLGQGQQELVHYHSCCEEEDTEPDASPWLSTQSPAWSSCGSLFLCSPGSRDTGRAGSDLGLSPSLLSSPGRLLPHHFLQASPEELSQVLFQDVVLSPPPAPASRSLAGPLQRKVAISLDHCYLSYGETSKTSSSPSPKLMSWSKQLLQGDSQHGLDGSESSGDEADDSTWTPPKRTKAAQAPSRKRKKWVSGKAPTGMEKPRLPLKKKCVNGFIMFCRLNRKQYIRACPGLASTAATRELAQLWRAMSKQERRPYCVRARRFSQLNNRIVRPDSARAEAEAEDTEPPKPLHVLLAEKALGSWAPSA
ncbi:basic helix-loop-helix and HMG box domain-containing protein 1 [Alligator mississippiensis]|uniref:Basic helix-loop-helix and HMG box domain-containing protein 1 n=1 Tax=Alligator mississippiensis TaxID=8496 RepID=A0A151MYZ4_ALLMI|nr:basic helix-loop-helix and HMG box domain-containing protein 1 [Alligator mississippiensis]